MGGQPVIREEHTFAWIQNFNTVSENLVKNHLAKYGFDSEMTFIPYSTRAAWCTKYPNAIPHVECVEVVVNNSTTAEGGGGVVSTIVRGYPLWSPQVNSVTDIPREVVEAAGYYYGGVGSSLMGTTEDKLELAAAMASAAAATATAADGDADGTNKRSREENNKLLPKSLLSNAQRTELHSEIYNYFVWLRTQVRAEGGKGTKSVGGMSGDGLKEVLRCLGENLPNARSSSSNGGGGGEEQPPPFLEEALFAKLKHRIDSGISSKRQKKSSGGSGGGVGGQKKVRKEKGPVVSWEERLKQLTEFKEEHGHFDVPLPLDDDEEEDVRFYNWVQKIHYELRGELVVQSIFCNVTI